MAASRRAPTTTSRRQSISFDTSAATASYQSGRHQSQPRRNRRVLFGPGAQLLAFGDLQPLQARRPMRQTNPNGDPITRDDNMASASLRFAPGGGRLRVMLRYTNLIDKYEGTYDSRQQHGERRRAGHRLALAAANHDLRAGGARGDHLFQLWSQLQRLLSAAHPLGSSRSADREAVGQHRGRLQQRLLLLGGNSPTGFGNVGIVAEVNYTMSVLSRAGSDTTTTSSTRRSLAGTTTWMRSTAPFSRWLPAAS
jgi:hypothetical protein